MKYCLRFFVAREGADPASVVERHLALEIKMDSGFRRNDGVERSRDP